MWYSTVYNLSNSGFDKFYATPWLPDKPHTILKEQTIFTRLPVRQTLQSIVQLIHPSTHPPTHPSTHPPTQKRAREESLQTVLLM